MRIEWDIRRMLIQTTDVIKGTMSTRAGSRTVPVSVCLKPGDIVNVYSRPACHPDSVHLGVDVVMAVIGSSRVTLERKGEMNRDRVSLVRGSENRIPVEDRKRIAEMAEQFNSWIRQSGSEAAPVY